MPAAHTNAGVLHSELPGELLQRVSTRLLMLAVISAMLPIALGKRALAAETSRGPNFIIIFADDLGYADLSCYGHPTIRTPHLDRMAAEGIRFTQFYTAASVCTPSRAGLLTGRLPIRNGMCGDRRRVLFPDSPGGLPDSERTIAEVLKEQGYRCGCFGKWHLGHLPQYLPTSNGFDTYFGIPYSNDMDRLNMVGPAGRAAFLEPQVGYWNVPLLRGTEIVERPADQTTITRRYTEEAIKFVREHIDQPFFVYLPHNLPHVPLFRAPEFAGVSKRGLYGDVIEEIDWSVGEILRTLQETGLDQNTYVFFTSDNGPWLTYGDHGGSAGLLKDGKGCTWEGGMRVPAIGWGPGRIPGGRTVTDLATTMDLYTTCIRLAGGELPADRTVDGLDLTELLRGTGPGVRETVYYYRGRELMALRHGPWKAHFFTQGAYGPDSQKRIPHDPPLLFQLEIDPGEQFNVNASQPEIVARLIKLAAEHRASVDSPPSELDRQQ